MKLLLLVCVYRCAVSCIILCSQGTAENQPSLADTVLHDFNIWKKKLVSQH